MHLDAISQAAFVLYQNGLIGDTLFLMSALDLTIRGEQDLYAMPVPTYVRAITKPLSGVVTGKGKME